MSVPIIAGLYPYTRNGIVRSPDAILKEIPQSLAINPFYQKELLILAGDNKSAQWLENFNLTVHHIFDDAPAAIHRDAVHKMKHWMCRWALKKYGEFLWVDWDTVLLRKPDNEFWTWCRHNNTPKFIFIPNYWAVVNCGVYYANIHWLEAMNRSFYADVSEPNDELLWASVLPENVRSLANFWWGNRVVNIWTHDEFKEVGPETYFTHVRYLKWAKILKRRARHHNP